MMHEALVAIIEDRVQHQFLNAQEFCETYLKVDVSEWESWKNGTGTLNTESMQLVKNLFSDYEWMLIQKLIRQAILFPEKRNYIVMEYKRLKTLIAKKWINSGEAMVELISQQESATRREKAWSAAQGMINLKVSLQYDSWGYDDILYFHLPAVVQRQIEDAPVDLLEWVNENLTETYIQEKKDV